MIIAEPDQACERALKVFEKQVGEATQIWYAGSAINEVSVQNKEAARACDLTPLFWNTVRGALQQYTLIAIGRIFDQGRKSPRTIDSILRLTYEGRETVFSKAALAARKRAGSANADEWLPNYMEGVSVPRRRDAKRLSLLVKKYRRIYESQYEEIRHRHIAHTALVDGPELWALHAKTNIRDLERLIVFLNKFHKALWEMYYNGRRPRLRPMRWSVRSLVRERVEKLRRGPVQEDIVAETKICLGLLTRAVSDLPRGARRTLRWGRLGFTDANDGPGGRRQRRHV